MSDVKTYRWVVAPQDVGLRFDRLLAARVPGLSRRKARVLIEIGGAFVDRSRVKVASRMLRAGQAVEVHLGGALDRASGKTGGRARAEDEGGLPAFAVLFEDEHLLVVEKPAGLLAAPTPESDRSNLADLLARSTTPPRPRIFVVHRLDLQTSGVLAYAKTPRANEGLASLFRAHTIERRYLALVLGEFPSENVRFAESIGGKPAVTHGSLRRRLSAGFSEIELSLETGRTHQIRIHLSQAGYPVLSDPRYGPRGATLRAPRMALHATHLGFRHPVTGQDVGFSRPWPFDVSGWLERYA